MKRAASAKALCGCTRNVISVAEQSRFKDSGSFGREVRCELLFQTLAPFVKQCQREKDTFVVQTVYQQRALYHAGGVVALALKILSQRRDAGVAKILVAIQRRHDAHSLPVSQF